MVSLFLLGVGWVAGFYCGYIKEKTSAWRSLEYKASHDALTGLYNRNFLTEWQQRNGEADFPLGVIVADINGLKLVNDQQGHWAGDKLIVAVAQLLCAGLRREDIVIRLGGDEFLMLLPKASCELVEDICARIRQQLALHNSEMRQSKIGISLGGFVAKGKGDLTKAINEADKAMYREKKCGLGKRT